jgi:hypothetical protein
MSTFSITTTRQFVELVLHKCTIVLFRSRRLQTAYELIVATVQSNEAAAPNSSLHLDSKRCGRRHKNVADKVLLPAQPYFIIILLL